MLYAAVLLTLIVLGGALLAYRGDLVPPQAASVLVAVALLSLFFLYACIAAAYFSRRRSASC